MMIVDPPIQIGSDQADYCVIWLHGLGADGNDFAPVVELLNLPNYRFILPHAPHQKVSLHNGLEMCAWYDLYSINEVSKQDEKGIFQTQSYIQSLVKKEQDSGIPSEKIILAGFSQGGAIALHTPLRHNEKLGGVIALSTYLPLKDQLSVEKSTENQSIPIFMAHGTHDEVITMETAELSLAVLKTEQYQVQWHAYAFAHSVSIEEIEEIRTFLLAIAE